MDVVEECFGGQGALRVRRVRAVQARKMTFSWKKWNVNTGAPIGREFPRFVIVFEISRPEVASRWRFFRKSCLFGKNDPLLGNLRNFPKGFITTQIHVFCPNFVKCSRPEVGKIARCLPDKKKQNFGWLSRSQNLPGPAASNVLRVLQTSSKSVHFRRSYSRTRRVNTAQTRHKVFPILGEAIMLLAE